MHDHVNSHFVKTAAASCSFSPSLLGIFDRASLPSLVKGYTETIIGSFPPLPFIKTERANACSFYRDSPKRNIFFSLGEEKFLFLLLPSQLPSAERSAFRGSLFKLSYQTRPSNCGDLSRPLGRLPRFFVDIYVAAVHRSLLRPNHRTICSRGGFRKTGNR